VQAAYFSRISIYLTGFSSAARITFKGVIMSFSDKNSWKCFFKGFNSALDLSPRILLSEESMKEPDENNWFLADANSLHNDWKKIGSDLDNSIRKYENSTGKDCTK
jgi:midasin (ATPase involved in ribosome maturation)